MTIHINYEVPFGDGPHNYFVTIQDGSNTICFPTDSEREATTLYGELISLLTQFNDCLLIDAKPLNQQP